MTNRNIDLRAMRYFVAVAEELHFSRAADRLCISQPSLSIQIKKLESSLGVALFERTKRSANLTKPGKVFYQECISILSAADRAISLTLASSEEAGAKIVVGFQANAAAELTPKILKHFSTLFPHAEIQMKSFDFSDPTAGLNDKKTDVAFVRPPIPTSLDIQLETLFIEKRLLVTPEESYLSKHDSISIDGLFQEPFVARQSPEVWRNFWLAIKDRKGFPVRIGAEVKTVDECFEAILSGYGVAFTPESTQRYYNRPGLSFIPVFGISPSCLSVAWRQDNNNLLVPEFINSCREITKKNPITCMSHEDKVGAWPATSPEPT